MTFKEFFSFRHNRFFWLNLLAMFAVAVGLLFATREWLDVYTRHGQAVVVPDVKGMTVAEATALCQKSRLQCVVADSTYAKQQPAGIILESNPAPGQKVKEGRTVYLTINTLNIPLMAVPDVADNSSLRQAQARMIAAGFKLTEEEQVNGERDWVYGVKYKGRLLQPGEEVPQGATLTLTVGNGMHDAFGSDSLLLDSTTTAEPPAEGYEDDGWF